MWTTLKTLAAFLLVYALLLSLHLPLLRLPYFWDEAGYYAPAAWDFYRHSFLIPVSTLPSGHTPLVLIYLGLAWRVAGCSALTSRAAMTLIAAATVLVVFALGRRVAGREAGFWSALLLALSPLFFAQSTLVHLDLAAALCTAMAVLFVLKDQMWWFALAASIAVLSKETAVVLLPVVWLHEWQRRRFLAGRQVAASTWCAVLMPALPLAAWGLYYHNATGYWIGNREYLSYNVYSTLAGARIFWSLLRRTYELFFSGFNWLLTISAVLGLWWDRGRRIRTSGFEIRDSVPSAGFAICGASPGSGVASRGSDEPATGSVASRSFTFLGLSLIAIYVLMLSVVGGAILPRYLLPVVPMFLTGATALVNRLPRTLARLILPVTAACFVASWFINPPYPFPYEDNLSYADFILLHEQAAHLLETQPGLPRILTAWPATDEITKPALGYVRKPLRAVPVRGFAPGELAAAPRNSFDMVYLYSRKWEPPGNWTARFPAWLRLQERYFDYRPQAEVQLVEQKYHLQLLAKMERRGQWVRIYANPGATAKSDSGSSPTALPPWQSAR